MKKKRARNGQQEGRRLGTPEAGREDGFLSPLLAVLRSYAHTYVAKARENSSQQQRSHSEMRGMILLLKRVAVLAYCVFVACQHTIFGQILDQEGVRSDTNMSSPPPGYSGTVPRFGSGRSSRSMAVGLKSLFSSTRDDPLYMRCCSHTTVFCPLHIRCPISPLAQPERRLYFLPRARRRGRGPQVAYANRLLSSCSG